MPYLVPKDNLQAANSLLQGTAQICLLFGAGAAGLLVDKFGTVPALVIDSVSFLFLVVALLGIPIKRNASAGESGILSGVFDGLRYVYKNELLRSLIVSFACINFCVNGALQIGFTALAKFRFNSSTAQIRPANWILAPGSLSGDWALVPTDRIIRSQFVPCCLP